MRGDPQAMHLAAIIMTTDRVSCSRALRIATPGVDRGACQTSTFQPLPFHVTQAYHLEQQTGIEPVISDLQDRHHTNLDTVAGVRLSFS